MSATPRGKGDLGAWLAWQEGTHPKAWDPGLLRIGRVWRALGAPRIAEHILTVAGTNGKGSCVAWAEAICRAHGVDTASFTSPHLLDYRERIRFDGEMIAADVLCAAFDTIDAARGETSLTFFEWSALAAFVVMAKRRPRVAILEVGLGGRLDAVNLLAADAVIFTAIGMDHQDWLGGTLTEIAGEKAGVLRKGQRVAFADACPPATVIDRATTLHAELLRYGAELEASREGERLLLTLPQGSYDLPLPAHIPGAHQYGHFAAVAAILGNWFTLDPQALSVALEEAKHPGRLMLQDGAPRYLIDVAHNADSAAVLADYLAQIHRPGERFFIVCGMLRDKDHHAIFSRLEPLAAAWFFGSLFGARGTAGETLAEHGREAGIAANKLVSYPHILPALSAAQSAAGAGDTIVVMGSFVTVSQVLTHWSAHE